MKKLLSLIIVLLLLLTNTAYAKPILEEPINNQSIANYEVDFGWTESYNFPLGYSIPRYSDLQISTSQFSLYGTIIKTVPSPTPTKILPYRYAGGYLELFFDYRGRTLYWRVKGNYRNDVTYTSWTEWSDTGSFYLDKFPTTITANYTHLSSDMVKISGELKANWNAWWKVPLSYRELNIEYFKNNTAINLKTIKVDNYGRYSFILVAPVAHTAYYQVKFSGESNYKESTTNPTLVTIMQSPSVSLKARPSKIKLGKISKLYGRIIDATGVKAVYIQLLKNKKWKIFARAKVKNNKFSLKIKPKTSAYYKAFLAEGASYYSSESKKTKVTVSK